MNPKDKTLICVTRCSKLPKCFFRVTRITLARTQGTHNGSIKGLLINYNEEMLVKSECTETRSTTKHTIVVRSLCEIFCETWLKFISQAPWSRDMGIPPVCAWGYWDLSIAKIWLDIGFYFRGGAVFIWKWGLWGCWPVYNWTWYRHKSPHLGQALLLCW